MQHLSVPQGQFDLARYPIRKNDTLRAWEAADELLLQFLAGETPDTRAANAEAADATGSTAPVDLSGTILIVNDGSGALATALADHHPVSLSDSYLSQRATIENLRRNRIAVDQVTLVSSLAPLPDRIDVVVLKVPKSLALLEDQLIRIAPALHEGSVVVAGAMTKHIHTSTIELFERILGPTTTSLAHKKARLVHTSPDPTRPRLTSPWPKQFSAGNAKLAISNQAGVFSAERLDIGTRFLLDNLPDDLPSGEVDGLTSGRTNDHVVDLGCGNGIVGLAAAIRFPDAEITFVDESYLAVASAEATFAANVDDDRVARFVVGDGLGSVAEGEPVAAGSVDLVLNNPPFHDNHAVGDATAWQMFTESHAALRAGGELWVVGNRHLAYHAKLKRIFGNCDVVASNAKFVVYRATR